MSVSVNSKAKQIVEEIIQKKEEIGILVEYAQNGATIIDAGIDTKPGYLAGKYLTEVCIGGFGDVSLSISNIGGIDLPSIFVTTDFPAISLLGSQFAGWRVKGEKYFAMGSGPARALSLKPKELYEKIGYQDSSDTAVIVLETSKKPPLEVLDKIADSCKIDPKNLVVLVAPTSSVPGSTQISGRVVETGLHRLEQLGMDLSKVLYACGQAPISPVHPDDTVAMGRTNDMLLYGGTTFFNVDYEKDDEIIEMINKAPSSTSSAYGKPFFDIFKEANFDFYKIDPNLFATASFVINNIRTGNTFASGKLNPDIIKQSIGM
jgi:methenyltetrahydromethanopterin cyclohydrolase